MTKADNVFVGADGDKIIIQFTADLDTESHEPTIVAEIELTKKIALLLCKKLEGLR